MFSDVQTFSFEANPYNFIQLRANLLLNDFIEKIKSYNRCVTDHDGRTNVSKPDQKNRGAATIGSVNESSEESNFIVTNLVIDSEFEYLTGGLVFIKMDIEGAEPAALTGMRSFAARNEIVIQIEDWDFPQGKIRDILSKMGFSLIRGMHPDYYYANFNFRWIDDDPETLIPIEGD